jgi:hypothetical protein
VRERFLSQIGEEEQRMLAAVWSRLLGPEAA